MTDRVIIVGGGVAGLAAALRLAPLPVTLIVSSPLGQETATGWAQGGIAAALGPDDRPDLHAIDTMTAGAGLSDPEVARLVATAAPAAIDWLASIGTPFDRAPSGLLALGLEAAHSRRRIVHAEGDATGRAVLNTLIQAVRICPSIQIMAGARATALLANAHGNIAGIAIETSDGKASRLAARAVVLATGGIGGLYASTTNPLGATGSGLALAARAGAVMRDMEFVQFHPTAITVAHQAETASGAASMPLATEALRGEGAILLNDRGERFMSDVPGRELAPRDVVARAIFSEITAGRHVVLDARLKDIERRFPSVTRLCRAHGIDPATMQIPVRPAAHYHMGGIKVDRFGRSSCQGLWACGEVASTGLHGANRLASNSLLEALVFAERLAADIMGQEAAPASHLALTPPTRRSTAHMEIRALMDRQVGVVRSGATLTSAIERLEALNEQDGDDLSLVALMVAKNARRREESRGGHYRSDFPSPFSTASHAETTLADALSRDRADAECERQVA